MASFSSNLGRAADALHRLIAKSNSLSRVYLAFVGALTRIAPKTPSLDLAISVLMRAPWREQAFRPRQVQIAGTITRFWFTPHSGEFDFEAHFRTQLNYEREVFAALQAQFSNYDAIIEIGANVGIFTLYAAHARRGAEVPIFCFEPSARAFQRLRENLELNAAKNVLAVPCAVSNESGLLEFYEPSGHLTNGSLLKEFASIFDATASKTVVPCIDGGQLLKLVEPYCRVLLKVDVEGAECHVLDSLRNLIEAKRPEILLEVLEPYAKNLNAMGWLTAYSLYQLAADGPIETSTLEAATLTRDYLLVPRESSQPTPAELSS